MIFAADVGYASDVPSKEKAPTELIACAACGLDHVEHNASGFITMTDYSVPAAPASSSNEFFETHELIAQAEPPDTSERTTLDKVDDVAESIGNVTGVDTVNSLDEVVGKGTYYFENAPTRGSPVGEWIAYIVGVIGFIIGLYFFVRSKWFSDK